MRFVLSLPLLLPILLCTCDRAQPDRDEQRPNILFILTDDQGIGDLSLHGNDSIRTPNIDALLRGGARFNRFYVGPVCAPTRASFLSGQYHPRTGAVFVTRRRETMSAGVKTLPEYLREAGYRTGLFGKWHNGATKPYDPAGQGFDEFLGFSLGHFNDYFNGELANERNENVPFQGDLTNILTDTATAFMLENSDRPFFAMLAYQAPHTPIQVADDHWNAVKRRGLTEYNTGIYAMVESIDEQIGEILAELKHSGVLDNTIVIFSTDNGPNGDRYRMGLKGTKGQVDEGSVRVPFAIKFPPGHELAASNTTQKHTPAAHIDLLPTVLDIIGEPVPEDVDGMSLRPLLIRQLSAGDILLNRNVYVFKQGYNYTGYPGSVRNSNALVTLRAPGRFEWYDLGADPGQMHDLSDRELPDSVRAEFQGLVNDYNAFAPTLARPALVAPPINLDAADEELPLLAHEGEPTPPTTFTDVYGWANDYFTHLSPAGAAWPITTSKDRTYDAIIRYHLTGQEALPLVLRTDEGPSAEAVLPPALTEQIPVADRVQRKEVYPRAWAETTVEGVRIPAGSTELRVSTPRATEGFWVKEVRLVRRR